MAKPSRLTETVTAKMTANERKRLADLARSAGLPISQYARRVLLENLDYPESSKLLLGHILAFQETVLAILKEVLADESVSKQRVDDIKEHFDDLKDGLAEMAIRKEKEF